MLDRLEELGLEEEGRLCGLAAGLAAGRDDRDGCRDILALEALCPMRWASSSRGVKVANSSTAMVIFETEKNILNMVG